MTRILGIDPGLTGAFAIYDLGSQELTVFDVPTYVLPKGGKKSTEVDEYQAARWLDDNAKTVKQAWIEGVGATPQMGTVSAFKFGRTYGFLRGLCTANFIPLEQVAPLRWKNALKVPASKDGARARASQFFPRYTHLWARAKDDGRAEAALIAFYGAQQLGS